ncbi:MAG: hypothetical protein KME04_18300 [Pleurocapsa minor GSE-CHR-MK-17-07R]|jgi:hypothetical protein|nr:hypothetical protein [Pleurocapsa minor GSE-CHR-MK 17-07R]
MMQPAQVWIPIDGLLALSTHWTMNKDGAHGLGDGFIWDVQFSAAHGGTWIDIAVTTERELVFNPAMIVWLGTLDNLNDRQAHTWRQTILRAPTTNQQGLGGNDLPAGYMYDAERHTETIVYVPPDSVKWAQHRFYELAIRQVIEYRPTPRYGIGLVPTIPDPKFTFSVGTHAFRLWYTQSTCDGTPTQWEAQQRLIKAITPLLDTEPGLIPDAPGWDVMARGTLKDLHDEACWVTAGGKTGLSAYVKGSSAVGRDDARGFELMTQLDVLLPLLHWRKQVGETGADTLIDRLMDAVRAYKIIDPHHYLPNHYPYRPTDTFMDTWYFYENALIKLPWVAYLTGDADLKQTFLTALEGGRELAHRSHHLLPLFADANGWQAQNSVLNVGVSGMYAAGCILAAQLTGDLAYETEAAAALDVMHTLPPAMLTHEPQQLSFAAAAAAYLGHHTAPDWVNLSLRMGYWGKDPGVPYYDARGMFQACASLSYPAYKENVETIWAWSELLGADATRDQVPSHLMAAFANLQRCHNYAFFDAFLPASLRRGPCPYIPYEDLATSEFTHTATLGKELYGAGEVFWSALLFSCPDFLTEVPADVLTLSLDVSCVRLDHQKSGRRRWLVYNPRSMPVDIRSRHSDFSLLPRQYRIVEDA